jgi:hypothetical protein
MVAREKYKPLSSVSNNASQYLPELPPALGHFLSYYSAIIVSLHS